MAFLEDLTKEVDDILNVNFEEREGQKVPEPADVTLKDGAVKLDAVILYADLDGSTNMVNTFKWDFSAKIYKSFLHACCRVIRMTGGEIIAFDGDRVMAIFFDGGKCTAAAKAALKINHVRILINERIQKKWTTDFELKHSVGIDRSIVRAVRTGIRGNNDLVWVGRAANYAAKLNDKAYYPYNSWITKDVYDSLLDESKYGGDGLNMWTKMNSDLGIELYASKYHWKN